MAIDPKTIKQLLQLQLFNSLKLSASNDINPSTEDGGAAFGDLLQNLLGQSPSNFINSNGQNHIIPASVLLSSTGSHLFPSSLSQPSSYDPLIRQASDKYGVDSSLVKAVIDAESSFNPHAVSSAGAKGLMQLMDDTGQGLGVRDPFDPQQNIHAGTQFLSGLLKKYNGNEGVALAAYNAGPGRVDRLGIHNEADLKAKFNQLPQETQHYIQKVLNLKLNYQGSI